MTIEAVLYCRVLAPNWIPLDELTSTSEMQYTPWVIMHADVDKLEDDALKAEFDKVYKKAKRRFKRLNKNEPDYVWQGELQTELMDLLAEHLDNAGYKIPMHWCHGMFMVPSARQMEEK